MFKICDEFANVNVPKSIKLSEKLSNKLEKLAYENNLSFNSVVLQCCKYALDNMEQK